MHAAIRGSKLVRIPHAGHSSSIEQPGHVTAAIEAWVGRLEDERTD
jgi:pimeloyl-ACP methyl ester carboxylesterase